MQARRLPLLVACALSLPALAASGCGAGEKSSADQFTGEQKKVATTVEDLQDAATKRDNNEICDHLLSQALVDQITKSSKRSCADEMKRTLQDIDSFELEVQKGGVAISGTSATVKVKSKLGSDSKLSTLSLVREAGRWKISKLG